MGPNITNISGVKYSSYNPTTGNIDLSIAENRDIYLTPQTEIISFYVNSAYEGTYDVSIDANFSRMDIINSNSQSLLNRANLGGVTLTYNNSLQSFTCTGISPTNSTLCLGDDTNLTSNTTKILASACTGSAKCEFICNTGYVKQGSVCVANTSYGCTGTVPSNASMCSGDDAGLTANTTRSLVSSCTGATKCEYICNSGYTKSGNSCTSNSGTFNCTGDAPANASMCSGDDTGLAANTNKTLVSSCTNSSKCEYICNSGYTKSGDTCQSNSMNTFNCTGSVPSNASMCSGDDTSLLSNTERMLVFNCTNNRKCEYVCSEGYEKSSNECNIVSANSGSNSPLDPGIPKAGNAPLILIMAGLITVLTVAGSIGSLIKTKFKI
jgi:hypothetical protein